MIVIGSIHFRDCPREKYIPIYLIIGGGVGIIKILFSLVRGFVIKDNNNDDEGNPYIGFTGWFIGCFLFCWFIAGNIWVYRIYNDFDKNDNNSPNYCHPTLYYFTFWIITGSYILIACISCSISIVGIYLSCVESDDD